MVGAQAVALCWSRPYIYGTSVLHMQIEEVEAVVQGTIPAWLNGTLVFNGEHGHRTI